MSHTGRFARWAGARFSRRLARSIPFLGAAVVLVTIGATVRRKGMVGGLADTGLNAIPFVGAAKNALEVARGEDFFPDRPHVAARRRATRRAARP